jgi:hypothetical protein
LEKGTFPLKLCIRQLVWQPFPKQKRRKKLKEEHKKETHDEKKLEKATKRDKSKIVVICQFSFFNYVVIRRFFSFSLY